MLRGFGGVDRKTFQRFQSFEAVFLRPWGTDQRLREVAVKVLRHSPVKPHYSCVPSETIWLLRQGTLNWLYLLFQVSLCLWILRERNSDSRLFCVKFKSWLYLQKSSNFAYYCVYSCLLPCGCSSTIPYQTYSILDLIFTIRQKIWKI